MKYLLLSSLLLFSCNYYYKKNHSPICRHRLRPSVPYDRVQDSKLFYKANACNIAPPIYVHKCDSTSYLYVFDYKSGLYKTKTRQ